MIGGAPRHALHGADKAPAACIVCGIDDVHTVRRNTVQDAYDLPGLIFLFGASWFLQSGSAKVSNAFVTCSELPLNSQYRQNRYLAYLAANGFWVAVTLGKGDEHMNMCAKRNSPWIHRADSQMPFDLMSDGGAEEAESGG